MGHSRQFSRDWAASGYRATSEALRATLQASAQALFKAAEWRFEINARRIHGP